MFWVYWAAPLPNKPKIHLSRIQVKLKEQDGQVLLFCVLRLWPVGIGGAGPAARWGTAPGIRI